MSRRSVTRSAISPPMPVKTVDEGLDRRLQGGQQVVAGWSCLTHRGPQPLVSGETGTGGAAPPRPHPRPAPPSPRSPRRRPPLPRRAARGPSSCRGGRHRRRRRWPSAETSVRAIRAGPWAIPGTTGVPVRLPVGAAGGVSPCSQVTPGPPLTVNTFGRKTTYTQIRLGGVHVRRGASAGDGTAIGQDGRFSVTQLADTFDVTTETVRRDLSSLERIGLVRRVHGGAVRRARSRPSSPRSGSATRPTSPPRTRSPPPPSPGSRRRVGRDPRCRVDHGAVRGRLPREHRLSVVTHAVPVAARLAGLPHIELHLLPGRVRPTTHAAVGTDTVAALGDLRADVAFVATNGLTADFGLSTPDRDEAATKRAITAVARRTVVLSDSSKIGVETARSASPRSATSTSWSPIRHLRGRPPGAREGPAWRSSSHDRHAHRQPQPRPHGHALGARCVHGTVQRAASVTSQAGGKGVNISRASVAAGVPTLAVLPAPKDDPFVHELLAAGIDCRPVGQPGRPARQHHHQRARRHHHQAQQPRPGDDRRHPRGLTETLQLRAREGDWVVLAGSLPPGTPVEWYAEPGDRAGPDRRAGRRRHQRRAAAARWSSGSTSRPLT